MRRRNKAKLLWVRPLVPDDTDRRARLLPPRRAPLTDDQRAFVFLVGAVLIVVAFVAASYLWG